MEYCNAAICLRGACQTPPGRCPWEYVNPSPWSDVAAALGAWHLAHVLALTQGAHVVVDEHILHPKLFGEGTTGHPPLALQGHGCQNAGPACFGVGGRGERGVLAVRVGHRSGCGRRWCARLAAAWARAGWRGRRRVRAAPLHSNVPFLYYGIIIVLRYLTYSGLTLAIEGVHLVNPVFETGDVLVYLRFNGCRRRRHRVLSSRSSVRQYGRGRACECPERWGPILIKLVFRTLH